MSCESERRTAQSRCLLDGAKRAAAPIDWEFAPQAVEALGTGKLYKKPVDAGVVLGDRLPHEDGRKPVRDRQFIHKLLSKIAICHLRRSTRM